MSLQGRGIGGCGGRVMRPLCTRKIENVLKFHWNLPVDERITVILDDGYIMQ